MLGDDWLKLDQDGLYDAFDEWLRQAANTDYWSLDNPTGQRIHWKSLSTIWERYLQLRSKLDSKYQFSDAEWKQQRIGISLDLPGCYLFGWGEGDEVVPRYVGQTGTNTLKGRLSNRYIPTKRFNLHPEDSKIRQCAIATWLTENGLAGVTGGWKSLPSEFDSLILKHHKNYGPGKAWVNARINDKHSISETVRSIKDNFNPALAVRHGEDYAKFGINEIWFALFPVLRKTNAKKLESELISTVRRWNSERGLKPILNKRG